MTPDQIIRALDKYFAHITTTRAGFPETRRFAAAGRGPTHSQAISHVAWMCQETKTFAQDNPEKAMRWLCFIQGVLWSVDAWTIDEFKDDNRT